ncbi:hypothetical protein jhhlp_003594 [Lomentospora prolificans]|uniref:Zn(2)-C6 fungal-type domain-containing protein n=1 Tax=Lomentospora prolificans TaxID=41688 RepID=A0A2N3N971_9PEZI|nr:hypothetical protein jhhlp_003594 [Lomentospora prolificans]
MSGSPPLPPKTRSEAGDRSQGHGPYPLPPQQHQHPRDVYRGHPRHQSHPEDVRVQLPTTLPPPPPSIRSYPQPLETSDRMGYYRPAEPPLPRRLSFPPPGPSHLPQPHQQPVYPPAPPATGASQSYAPSTQASTPAATSFEPPRPARKAKGHVASACVPCKKAHLRCDAQRPCSRCLMNGKEDSCIDVQHKKRGRPRLRDDRDARFDGSRFTAGQDTGLRRPLGAYPGGSILSGYEATLRRNSPSHRVLKSQPSESTASRYIERALPSDASVYPATPLSVTTRPPEPVAYLTMELEIVKASTSFLEVVGIQSLKGRALYDVVLPAERDRVDGYKRQLHDDRARQEPRYLPPIFNKHESERVIQALGFGAEDFSRIPLDRPGHLTFLAVDGQQRSLSFQFGLTKVESIYVVVLRLNVASRYPYPSPSPHSRDTMAAGYPYQTQAAPHHQQQQSYLQHTPVSATFDPHRPRFEQSPQVGRPVTAPPGNQLLSGLSPGVPAYSPSSGRPEYAAGPSSYQIPRSELTSTSRTPQAPSFQLPPIRAHPQPTTATLNDAPLPRDERPNRVDIGGLIDRPDHIQRP